MIRSGWDSIKNLGASPTTVTALTIVAGVVGVGLARILPNAYTRVLPWMVLFGGILGSLAIWRSSDSSISTPQSVSIDVRILGIAFMLLSALIFVVYRQAGYTRTLLVHSMFVLLFALAFLSVFTHRSQYVPLGYFTVAGILHRSTLYYASATQAGHDALFHNRLAKGVVSTASLDPLVQALTKYFYTPLYHIYTAFASELFTLGVRDAAALTTLVVFTLVSILLIHVIARWWWDPKIATLAAGLYTVADYPISWAARPQPTTFGILFFILVMYAAIKYRDRGTTRNLGIFLIVFTALAVSHQISLFIGLVGIGSYLLVTALYREASIPRRELHLTTLMGTAVAGQWLYMKYHGPEGDLPGFLPLMSVKLITKLQSTSSRAAVFPPENGFVVAGSNALTWVHTAGTGLLFFAAVAGSIIWLSKADTLRDAAPVVGLGVTVTVMSGFIFVLPIVGLDFFVPRRWFAFIYVCLILLALPVVHDAISRVSLRPIGVSHGIALLCICLLFTGLMVGNYPGAIDGPVFDDASGAQRFTSTTSEAAMYQHLSSYPSEATIVADHMAWQMIERHYGTPAVVYQTGYPPGPPTQEGEVLVADRPYARSWHAGYYVLHDGGRFMVRGPIPDSGLSGGVVYTNGVTNVTYRNQTAQ